MDGMADEPRQPPVSVEITESAERRAIESALGRSQSGGMTAEDRRVLRVGRPQGMFAAQRLLEGSDTFESELLNRRAKIAFLDSAALCVPAYFNELAAKKPNKARLDGYMAAMRGAGIVVDTAPVSPKDRDAQIAADRVAASATNEEIKAKIAERMRALQAGRIGDE